MFHPSILTWLKKKKKKKDLNIIFEGYLRIGGLDILPSLGEVLFELVEGAQPQLPLQIGRMSLFGQEHLSQGVDLLLHLTATQQTGQPLAGSNVVMNITIV